MNNNFIRNQNDSLSRNERYYNIVSDQNRAELIRLTHQEQFTIAEAAKILHINYSTAKTIVRIYRKTGRLFRKRNDIIASPDVSITN